MKILARPRIGPRTFARILQTADSPAAPAAELCYNICVQHGVDPAIALAFFRKESSFGKAGVATQTRSWGNVRQPYIPTLSTGFVQGPYASYKDWHTSLLDWCLRIKERYVNEWGLTTVAEILPRYAPPSDGNDTALYVQQIHDWVSDWSRLDMDIKWVGMTRSHFQAGGNTRRAVVVHSTAGRYPGDYDWLRQGGSTSAPVSCHYYINKAGAISQMVRDEDIAWHAGQSTWVVDGRQVSMSVGLNPCSVGIELENRNDGNDSYPQAQYRACVDLTRHLVERYDIPRSQLVRHLDIAPGRKTDPAGFPWQQFVGDVYECEPEPEPELVAPAWYAIAAGGTTNVRYQPEVTPDNIGAQLRAGRVHVAEWLPDVDPEYGGRWARLSTGGYAHESGLEAE
jgi:hypothetical protein